MVYLKLHLWKSHRSWARFWRRELFICGSKFSKLCAVLCSAMIMKKNVPLKRCYFWIVQFSYGWHYFTVLSWKLEILEMFRLCIIYSEIRTNLKDHLKKKQCNINIMEKKWWKKQNNLLFHFSELYLKFTWAWMIIKMNVSP